MVCVLKMFPPVIPLGFFLGARRGGRVASAAPLLPAPSRNERELLES